MKNKKKGFTLIEILAVVTIIGLIFILVIPKITNSLKNKKSDVDSTTTNIVLSATKLYVQEHSSKFEKTDGNISCMPINQLVKKGYLEGPVKNVTDDEDITDTKSVKITYDKGFKYEIVGKKDCRAIYLQSKFKDFEGNEYTRLEYIESDGNQFIDLDLKGNENSKVEFSIRVNQSLGKKGIFGFYGANENSYYLYSSSNKYFQVGYKNWRDTNIIIKDNTDYVISNNNNIIIINENSYELPEIDNFETSDNLYLFNLNGGSYSGLPMRLYYFKLYDGNKLVRDYIPTVDKDNKVCLFDKVDSKCYYNQGTGNFKISDSDFRKIYEQKFDKIYDNDDNKYLIVNYIETQGTQYAVTDKYLDSSELEIKMNIHIEEMPSREQNIIGNQDNSTGRFVVGLVNNKVFAYSRKNSTDTNAYSNVFSGEQNLDIVVNYSYENRLKKLNVNGTLVEQTQNVEITNSNSFITIFNGAYNRNYGYVGKFYSMKITKNTDEVMFDLIPAIDENQIPCLFDKVEKKCYYNQGTGEFLWG